MLTAHRNKPIKAPVIDPAFEIPVGSEIFWRYLQFNFTKRMADLYFGDALPGFIERAKVIDAYGSRHADEWAAMVRSFVDDVAISTSKGEIVFRVNKWRWQKHRTNIIGFSAIGLVVTGAFLFAKAHPQVTNAFPAGTKVRIANSEHRGVIIRYYGRQPVVLLTNGEAVEVEPELVLPDSLEVAPVAKP